MHPGHKPYADTQPLNTDTDLRRIDAPKPASALRVADFFGRNWRIRVYDRRKSVLVVARGNTRGIWNARVADRETMYQTMLTSRELRLFLRAWLSPLSPPPAEKLTDLM